MRLGELVNMKWSWIDFNQNLITVKNSNGFTTKSKEERVIPIHQKVKETFDYFTKIIFLVSEKDPDSIR